MTRTELRFRQIHLDFHTSEAIVGIGDDFDADEFATTLAHAHVNSVTCFARGHHGWNYYDSKLFPERRHPHLSRNLLAEQIEACHKLDIRVPIYVTVQWDQYTANLHPEWRVVNPDGSLEGTPPYEAGFYRRLCINTPYREFLKAQANEIMDLLPTDGFFFDITAPMDCSCRYCREKMVEQGLEPSDETDRKAFGLASLNEFMNELSTMIWARDPECTIFYNPGHIGYRHRASRDAHSHFELESLPSGGWGYDHFPVSMRYARTLGLDCLGMTGKFHTSWGDFHSFKNQAALEFECFNMLALGAKCSIGDQLHPSGQIDPDVYDLIGAVYSQVEAKEPWCVGAKPLTEIAVYSAEQFGDERVPATSSGALHILEEGGFQFDFIDTEAEIEGYRLVILPDEIPCDQALEKKLAAFVAKGGSIIASYRGGLNPITGQYPAFFGLTFKGDAPYSPDFIVPEGAMGEGLRHTEYVMYKQGALVVPQGETRILCETIIPYFNRTYKHYCSHRHTPSSGESGYPAVTQQGQIIYFAHPLFSQYAQNAPNWCKLLVHNAMRMLLGRTLVKHDGPSTLKVTLNEQAQFNRQVVHLLHYIPERRCQDMDIIEDIIPLYNVGLEIACERPVKTVTCEPQGTALGFSQDDVLHLTVPEIRGHQMICITFA